METRANYVLIGLFTLVGFVAMIAAFLWFARVQLDQQFAYYEVRFTSVSGLARASEVRFAGLSVGQVVDLRLSPDMDGTVLVRLEVAGDTPVRADSVATVESMGVTGVSFIGISAGSPDQPLLSEQDGIPEITAGRSALQSITEDAPEILSEALEMLQRLGEVLSDENAQRVGTILANLETASGDLEVALDSVASITEAVGSATTEVAAFTRQLEPVIGRVSDTLETVDTALEAVTGLAGRITTTLDEGDAVLQTGRGTLESFDRFLAEGLPPVVNRAAETLDALRTQLDTLGGEAQGLIAELTAAGTAATARLTEAEATLAAATALTERMGGTLDTVDRVAGSAEALLTGEGAALISDARTTLSAADGLIAAATRLADDDLPRVLADVRAAANTARRVTDDVGHFVTLEMPRVVSDITSTTNALRRQIDTLGPDAQALMAQLTETGSAATARLTEAEATIAAVNALVARLGPSLDAFDRVAGSAETLLAGDGAALLAEGRATLEAANAAIGSIARMAEAELPALLDEVRTATANADRVIAGIGTDFSAAAGRLEQVGETADAALASANETFSRATRTLDAVDAALATGNRTLEAAERAFEGADRVINDEVAAIAADLRATLATLDAAVAQVSADLPEISADLRSAADSAGSAFDELARVTRDTGPPLREFAATGLPQFGQLAREARSLVNSLDRLSRQIERDPARFFLQRQTPEFRR